MTGGTDGRRGRDVETEIDLDVEEAAVGVLTTLRFALDLVCATCDGAGAPPGSIRSTCYGCGGGGAIDEKVDSVTFSTVCFACGGLGYTIVDPCTTCSGSGSVSRQREVKVRLPAGIEDGQRVRLRNQGEPGRNGGAPGDLYLICRVNPPVSASSTQAPAPGPRFHGHAFISYSRTDDGYVQRLCEHLHQNGVPTWTDSGIRHGARWTAAIEKAIADASVVIVVMTPSSKASDWVERELILAERLGKPLAPLLLEGSSWWTISNLQYETVAGGRLPSDAFVERLWRSGTSESPPSQRQGPSGGVGL